MNLCAIDINISDFGQGFNPSKLDYNNSERENIRRSVLNVQNIRRNADGYLATVPHDNDSLLWLGGKRIQNDRFALLLAHKKFISEDEYYL